MAHAPLRIVDLDAARALFSALRVCPREMAAIAYLDPEWRLLGMRHITGHADWVAIPITVLARDLFAFGAAAVVVAHSHPSGDASASDADLAFTRTLGSALRAIGVVLADHLIVAGDRVVSLRAQGVI